MNNRDYVTDGALTVQKIFNEAEELLKNENDSEAYKRYQSILDSDPNNIFCLFRLGEISNRTKEIDKSIDYHTKAFGLDNRLAEKITADGHVSHNYVYKPVSEVIVENCPLCGFKGKMYSCYNDVTNVDFIEGFNPIRIWMFCSNCNHVYARNYPKELIKVLSNSQCIFHMKPNIDLLPMTGEVIKGISKYSKGKRLLDIGVGAGELAAVAKEYQYSVNGIEIRKAYSDQVSRNLNIDVYNIDFMEYNLKEKYDVICMGDVIEHLTDPISAIKKINSLLNDNGVFWISTPNFLSAYSLIMKDNDPMWRVCEHLNYFSYDSLDKLLQNNGFEVVEYRSSSHYRGSMEVTAVKKSNPCVDNTLQNINIPFNINNSGKVNIGCGKDIKKGWINIDRVQNDGVDVIADLDNCRNTPLPFDDSSINEIYASHVIEHIKNPLSMMQELHRISAPNAKAVFKCFYGASDDASEDPTHARQYFLNSFGYFSQPFYWRADYGYRGDWLVEKVMLYVDGHKYKDKNKDEIFNDINKYRNVVKEMRVELRTIKPIRDTKKELQTKNIIDIVFI